MRDAREVLNGVLWVLRSGAPWHDLPDRCPLYETCDRRFQRWAKNDVFRDLLTCLAEDLCLRGKIDLTEGFIDASFTATKKGGSQGRRRAPSCLCSCLVRLGAGATR